MMHGVDGSSYVLQAKLEAHGSDVRSIAVLDPDTVATGSRDASTIIWKRSEETGQFSPSRSLTTHSQYVNALAYIPPNCQMPKGLLASAGSSNEIHIYEIDNYEAPPVILKGHAHNICSLVARKNGDILSGSWDQTAIVWKGNKALLTLKHSSAVWGLAFVSENQYLTASDKSVTLWENSIAKRRYNGHEDCVRDIAMLDNCKFATCSNDGTIRIWDLESSVCLHTMRGHSSFVYSICDLRNDMLASGGEDGTIRIWKKEPSNSYSLLQTIHTPSISVWCVKCIGESDIIIGGSDHMSYIFTADLSKSAPDAMISEFENKAKLNEDPLNANPRFKDSDLHDPSVLKHPGASDGKVVLVKDGCKVFVHKWSKLDNRWDYVGEAIQSQTRPKHQKAFEGKIYDYVFDVHMEDTGAVYKLPYNISDNPYTTAYNFIQKNDLSQTHLDSIVEFINNSVEVPTIGSAANNDKYCDPYTGKSRYIPEYSQPVEHSGIQPEMHIISPTRIIPMTTYYYYKNSSYPLIIKKIKEFNDKVDTSVRLGDESLNSVLAILDSAKNFKLGENDIPALELINNTISSWPLFNIFPFIDLIGLLLLCSFSSKNVRMLLISAFDSVVKLLDGFTFKSEITKEQTAIYIFTGRAISNSFNPEIECNLCVEKYHQILDTALKLLKKCDNNAVRGPWISVILNYTITTYKYSKICSEQLCDTVYDAIVACYDLDLDAGNMHKVAISLGTMIFKEKDILSKIKAEKIRNDLTKGNFPRGESDDVSKVMREVDDMLNNVT